MWQGWGRLELVLHEGGGGGGKAAGQQASVTSYWPGSLVA